MNRRIWTWMTSREGPGLENLRILLPLAILAIALALALGASATWRTRRGSETWGRTGRVLAQSLLIGQPFLLALVPIAVIFG